MQYALLIYSKPGAAEALSADDQAAHHRDYMARPGPGALLDPASAPAPGLSR